MNVLRDKSLGTTRMFPTISYSLLHSRLKKLNSQEVQWKHLFPQHCLGLVVTWSCSTSFFVVVVCVLKKYFIVRRGEG